MDDELERLETMREAKPSRWGWLVVLIAAVLFFGVFLAFRASGQTPEELYEAYSTPETRAILEQFDEVERRCQEAEEAEKTRKTLALAAALLIAAVPLVKIGWDIIRQKTWQTSPGRTVQALAVGLAGGAVLFAFNYGIFLLKIRMGDAFNTALAFLLVAAMLIGALYLMRGKKLSGK